MSTSTKAMLAIATTLCVGSVAALAAAQLAGADGKSDPEKGKTQASHL